MAKQLEAWARKYTARGPAVKWHEILKVLGAPGMPKINQVDEGTATVNFGLKERRGDPISVMEYNANGLTARWKDHSASNTSAKQDDGQIHPSKHAKSNSKLKFSKKVTFEKSSNKQAALTSLQSWKRKLMSKNCFHSHTFKSGVESKDITTSSCLGRPTMQEEAKVMLASSSSAESHL
jgi:hypothetical protein